MIAIAISVITGWIIAGWMIRVARNTAKPNSVKELEWAEAHKPVHIHWPTAIVLVVGGLILWYLVPAHPWNY
jgi:hypothetical protein